MHVRFLRDHAYKPIPNETTDYKKGHTANLPHLKAQALIDRGIAEAVESKGRPQRPGTGKAAKPEAEAKESDS